MRNNTKLRDARRNSQPDRNTFGLGLATFIAVVLLASCAVATPQPAVPAPESAPLTEPVSTVQAGEAGDKTVTCGRPKGASPFSTQERTDGTTLWWNEPETISGTVGGGIAVFVPVSDTMQGLTVLNLNFETPEPDGDFTMIRPVVNVEVVDPQDCLVESFPIPIQLYIAYTVQDLDQVEGGKSYPGLPGNLAFAYYDDENAKWVRFSSENDLVFLHQDGDKLMKLGLDPESKELKWLDACPGEQCTLPAPCNDFPNADGCAFVTVESWADRRIGGGY